ncbi:MAG: response regulator [Gammaproteobacteria bacterium]
MKNDQHILVVEDEPKIAQLLIDYLTASHYKTSWLENGSEVVSWVSENKPDLILLDLMLPGKDGIEICQEVREFSQVPVMMLTARVEEIDRILGLEIGADDYVCKPFSPREVMTRVKALLRRANFSEQKNQTSSSILNLNVEKFEARYLEKILDLTRVEFRLLHALSERPGFVFSRQKLIDQVYDDHRVVSDRTMDTHIKNLRKKIQEADGDPEMIRSIYGIGYKFDDSVLV